MTRVLVVEDSMVSRQLLVAILSADPELEVVGQAASGAEGVRLAAELAPDIVTMDVQMPGLDGLQATQQIMSTQPRPIVIVSAQDPADVRASMASMGAGALAVLAKPAGPSAPDFTERSRELCRTVKAMSDVKVVRRRAPKPPREAVPSPPPGAQQVPRRSGGPLRAVVVGASTGGPDALREFLSALPADLPVPVLIVQHISQGFHQGLADWLDGVVTLDVSLAQDGELARPGQVLLAGGDGHLTVKPGGRIQLDPAPPVGSHRPSATMLFRSAAQAWGSSAVGVILTGMGEDGAEGLEELHAAGATIYAQDEASCVVYGMPKAACQRGVVTASMAPAAIARTIAQGIRAG